MYTLYCRYTASLHPTTLLLKPHYSLLVVYIYYSILRYSTLLYVSLHYTISLYIYHYHFVTRNRVVWGASFCRSAYQEGSILKSDCNR